MTKPCLDMCKQILEDNADIRAFINTSFGDFWTSTLDYFRKKCKPQLNAFKKLKCVKPDKVIKALQKMVPLTTPDDYRQIDKLIIPTMSKVFAFLLHPDTPEDYRTGSLQQFLNILLKLDDNEILNLQESLQFIVPFVRLAQDESEKKSFATETLTNLENPNMRKGDTKDTIQHLNHVLKFLSENWDARTNLCRTIFYQYIISVCCHKLCQDVNFETTGPGINGPTPDEIQNEIINFFNNIVSLDFRPLLQTEEEIKLIIALLHQTAGRDSVLMIKSTCQIAAKFVSDEELSEVIKEKYPNSFKELGQIIVQVVINQYDPEAQLNQEITSTTEESLITYFSSILTYEEATVVEYIKNVFDMANDSAELQIFLTRIYISFLMNMKIKINAYWMILSTLARSKPPVAASCCKFSQFLAICAFPSIFGFNPKSGIELCNEISTKRQHRKTLTKFDYLASNMEVILEKPYEFARDNLKSMWEPFDEYDYIIVQLPQTNLNTMTDDELNENSEIFLGVFDSYYELTNTKERNNLYSVLLTFYATLATLANIPPEVTYDITNALVTCSERLFKAILGKPDEYIFAKSLPALSQIINSTEMKMYLDNVYITHWYLLLLISIANEDMNISEYGFNQFVKSLRIGLVGSNMLIPFVISMIEKELLAISPEMISFLTCWPTFEDSVELPKDLLEEAKKRVKRTELFTFSTKDLRNRSLTIVKKIVGYSEDGRQPWSVVIPLISSVIVDEISRDKPNGTLIGEMLSLLIKAATLKSQEAVKIIKSFLIYAPKIASFCKDQYIATIDGIIDIACQVNPSDESSWIYAIVETATYIVIYNFSILKNSTQYVKYSTFLHDMSYDPSKSSQLQNGLHRFLSDMLELLITYYGSYPFPHSALAPSNNSTSMVDDVTKTSFFTPTTSIIHPINKVENKAMISTQTLVGHFNWDFECIYDFYDKQSLPEMKLQITNNDSTIPNISTLQPQKDFEKNKTNNVESYYKAVFPDESSELNYGVEIDDIVGEIQTEYKQFNQLKPITVKQDYQPPTEIQNIASAVVTSCGFFNPTKNEKSVSRIETDHRNAVLYIQAVHKKNHRKTYKVPVLFANKEVPVIDNMLALQLEDTSPHFHEFLHALGWVVDLSTHGGYLGDLDPTNHRTGKASVYYADFFSEIMFHVPALMETSKSDPQQLFKKRILQDDLVQIVWCESPHEYDQSISALNSVLITIIIYPLQNGLFRVEVKAPYHDKDDQADELENWIGPLTHSTVVTKKALASQVRATVMMCLDNHIMKSEPYAHPQSAIYNIVNDLIHSHSANDKSNYRAIQELMVSNHIEPPKKNDDDDSD